MKNLLKSLFAASVLMLSLGATAEQAQGPSLWERLGGEAGARQIVADTYHNHKTNPIVKNRFEYSDDEYVKQRVYEIFAMATGSPNVTYDGDLAAFHKPMNINEMEFNAVVDDVMAALDKNNVGQQEKNEVLAILWGARPAIVNMNVTTEKLAPPAEEAAHAH